MTQEPFHEAKKEEKKVLCLKRALDAETTQHYCCVVIPALVDIGGPWKVLPPGIHETNLGEVRTCFATNEHRETLYEGLVRGLAALCEAGCRLAFVNGSFVSDKPKPRDFDVCWDPAGVNPALLDRTFLDFSESRRKQKEKFEGEFFPASSSADGGRTFVEFFQIDRHTGVQKGILKIQMIRTEQP